MKLRAAGLIAAASLLVLPGCKDEDKSDSDQGAAKAATAVMDEGEPTAQAHSADATGRSGRHRAMEDWVPAEFKSGRGRWKSAGIYVDGKPVGMLWYGELPRTLETVWVEDVEGLDFGPGDTGPRERVIKERRYRVTDYLEAVGVDLEKIKAIHLYGGKNYVIGLSGDDVRKYAKEFYFGFGRGTSGKAIPYFPPEMPINTVFDRIVGIAAYVDREPPQVKDDHAYFGDELVKDIPYFGEPLRGGIRVYKDDVLATVLKRHSLEEFASKHAVTKKNADGQEEQWYHLWKTLEAHGVETGDIVDGEIIYDERRTEIVSGEKLSKRRFLASSQMRGAMLLDDEDGTVVEALALYTRKLTTPPPAPEEE